MQCINILSNPCRSTGVFDVRFIDCLDPESLYGLYKGTICWQTKQKYDMPRKTFRKLKCGVERTTGNIIPSFWIRFYLFLCFGRQDVLIKNSKIDLGRSIDFCQMKPI